MKTYRMYLDGDKPTYVGRYSNYAMTIDEWKEFYTERAPLCDFAGWFFNSLQTGDIVRVSGWWSEIEE